MNPNVADAMDRLQTSGLNANDVTRGCSPAEIAALEGRNGVALPGAYREFLGRVGHDAGAFLRGSDFGFAGLTAMQAEARELFAQSGATMPDSAFVFVMHQGYGCLFFPTDGGDDPRVHRFEEGGPSEALDLTFSEWFLRAVDDEIRLAEGGEPR